MLQGSYSLNHPVIKIHLLEAREDCAGEIWLLIWGEIRMFYPSLIPATGITTLIFRIIGTSNVAYAYGMEIKYT